MANFRYFHLANAGDEGGKGTHNGYEAGKNNHLAAVLVVEPLRAVKVFWV